MEGKLPVAVGLGCGKHEWDGVADVNKRGDAMLSTARPECPECGRRAYMMFPPDDA